MSQPAYVRANRPGPYLINSRNNQLIVSVKGQFVDSGLLLPLYTTYILVPYGFYTTLELVHYLNKKLPCGLEAIGSGCITANGIDDLCPCLQTKTKGVRVNFEIHPCSDSLASHLGIPFALYVGSGGSITYNSATKITPITDSITHRSDPIPEGAILAVEKPISSSYSEELEEFFDVSISLSQSNNTLHRDRDAE